MCGALQRRRAGSLAGPYALQFLIDAVFSRGDATLLNRITLILIGIFALQSVVYFVRGYLLATKATRSAPCLSRI